MSVNVLMFVLQEGMSSPQSLLFLLALSLLHVFLQAAGADEDKAVVEH